MKQHQKTNNNSSRSNSKDFIKTPRTHSDQNAGHLVPEELKIE